MIGVIYKVTNTVNGKIYVGQTTVLPSTRWAVHKSEARRRPSSYFHKAIAKYGDAAWIFEVLEECESYDRLNEREHIWILALRSFEQSRGYNLTLGGENGERTAAARLKNSLAQRGKKASAETRAKMSAARKGRKHSLAHVAAVAAALKGRTPSLATRLAVSESNRRRAAQCRTQT